jgi:hypothetical protein
MEGPNQVSLEAYRQAMYERVRQALDVVMRSVNDAPDGAWINASEMAVFAAFADLRREAYQTALQMRADAASSASAFSPDRPGDRPASPQQGR